MREKEGEGKISFLLPPFTQFYRADFEHEANVNPNITDACTGGINRHVVSLRTRIRAPVNYYVPSLPFSLILPRLHPRCTTSSHFYRHAFMFRGKWHVNSNAILFKGQLTPCVVPLFRLLTSFRIQNDFSRELKGFDGKKLLEKGEKHFDISCFEFNKYRWIYR